MDNGENETKDIGKIVSDITDTVKKITSALYRVTDLLSDKEPIKWTLRNKALVLYDNLLSIVFIKDKNMALNEITDTLCQTINLLELCSNGSSISSLNFEILKREYLKLKSFIDGNREIVIYGQPLLPETTMGDESGEENKVDKQRLPTPVSEKTPLDKNHDKNHGVNVFDITDSNGRKQRIFQYLKKEGPKTISEIALIFNKKISVKTTQRDLASLFKDRKISAKGEKRWRLYAVV